MVLGLPVMALMVTAEAGIPPLRVGEVKKITNIEASYPFWSPDSTRIIFNSTRDAGETDDVYAMKADGSDVRRLTQNDIDDTYASWSPDGRKIALRKRIKEPGIDGEGKPSSTPKSS